MAPPNNLTEEAIETIVSRLSSITSIPVPGQLARGDREPTVDERAKYVRALLSHDPGVFLERHGELLTASERTAFHPLRAGSYEVDLYLKLLEDNTSMYAAGETAGPSGRGAASSRTPLSATAKNRRLAHMQRLEATGYFDEDAMREREPYLHHLFIGQYNQGPRNNGDGGGGDGGGGDGANSEPTGAENEGGAMGAEQRATAALAGSIMDRQDELERLLRREAEREAYDQQEEESESDDEDGGRIGSVGVVKDDEMEDGGPGAWPAPKAVTAEQRVENAAAFEDAVKQRFLGGRDKEVDYAAVDADQGLDEHFAAEEARDAEERYFDAD